MVVLPGGTAPKAQVPGYRVAGKTGTAHKLDGKAYSATEYVASFVGFAPVSNPRLIVAVMGGALILVSIVITTLLWADLRNRFIWLVLIVTIGFGAIGWVDDYRKVVHRNPKGLSARSKFVLQSVIGLIAAIYLAFSVSAPSNTQFFQLFYA